MWYVEMLDNIAILAVKSYDVFFCSYEEKGITVRQKGHMQSNEVKRDLCLDK